MRTSIMRFPLLIALAALSCLASSAQATENPDDTRGLQAFITDYNLIRRNDDGARLGIVFLHELYKSQPGLDPATALAMTERVQKAWDSAYGPGRAREEREPLVQLEKLGKVIRDVAGGKVGLQQAVDLLEITVGEWDRMNRQFEHRLAFVQGQAVLKDIPASWTAQYSVLMRPEAMLDALEFADTNRKAADALSVLLRKVNKVGVNEPLSEWLRKNPEAREAIRLFHLEEELGKLRGDLREVREALARLQSKVTTPAKAYLKDLDRKIEKTREEREQELREQFAPYFALNQLLATLGRNNRDIQVVAHIVDSGLKMSMISAGIAAGTMTGVGAVVTLGATFIGLWSSLGDLLSDRPTDTQVILAEIDKVRKDIRALHEAMLVQFADLRDYLNTFAGGVHQRFDTLEFQLAYMHRDLAELFHANAYATAMLGKRQDKFESDVLKLFSAQRQSVLRPHVLRKDRTELELSAFQDSLDVFLSAATGDARDEVEVGPSPTFEGPLDPDNASLNAEVARLLLSSGDLWGRLGVLRRVGPAYGIDLAPDLASPRLWSFASRSYLDLARKWPKYYKSYDPELTKLSRLLETGYQLRQGAAQVVPVRRGVADPTPLLKLVQGYKANAQRLDGLLKAAANRVSEGTAGYDSLVPLDEQEHGTFAPKSDPFIPIVPMLVPLRTGGGFIQQGSPTDPGVVPDPKVKLDPKLIALEPDDLKRMEKLVPAEFRAAEKLGLGRIYVGLSPAGLGEECWVIYGNVQYLLDKGKVVYDGVGKDKPKRAPPDEIRKLFPNLTKDGFKLRSRYVRLSLEYHAYFQPADRPDLKLPIFRHRVQSPQYYCLGYEDKTGSCLIESEDKFDLRKPFADQFNSLLPNFRKQFRQEEAKEMDAPGVEFGRAEILKRLDKALLARGRELIAAQKAAFANPGGEVASLVETISSQRLLLHHFLVLGLGDWLAASPEGAELVADAKALKTGEEMAQAVAASPATFLSRKTRKAAVNLLFAPAEKLEGTLKRVVRLPSPPSSKARPEKDAGLLFRRHALIEDTLTRLERYYDQQAAGRDKVTLPARSATELVAPTKK